MGYEVALGKAWERLGNLAEENHTVRFLSDNYEVKLAEKEVLSFSCNVPAKDYTGILILHYLAKKLRGLPPIKGEWISFKELPGGAGYYPSFKKRVIDTVMRKYGQKPDALLDLVERFKAKTTQVADISVVLDVFDEVPVLMTLWRGDDEFGPEANVLFDKSITDIFCTEDIVVLSEIIVHSI
ncbi:DUF3786 domain-containing protein [Candidatus Omnitrophota bacterium]